MIAVIDRACSLSLKAEVVRFVEGRGCRVQVSLPAQLNGSMTASDVVDGSTTGVAMCQDCGCCYEAAYVGFSIASLVKPFLVTSCHIPSARRSGLADVAARSSCFSSRLARGHLMMG